MEWETKAQNFLIAIIVAAILDFLIGSVYGPYGDDAPQTKAEGFMGFSCQ